MLQKIKDWITPVIVSSFFLKLLIVPISFADALVGIAILAYHAYISQQGQRHENYVARFKEELETIKNSIGTMKVGKTLNEQKQPKRYF